jgi:glycosyltransferase involved in cell wall biosynthesis
MTPSRESLTVCLVVKDEEQNLARLLPALQGWADHLVILDTGSRDGTIALAQQYQAEVHCAVWRNNFAEAKNHVLNFAPDDWVLLLDADEIPSAKLKIEIHDALTNTGDNRAFTMPRLNHLMGRPLQHGALYPDSQIKLFRKSCTTFHPPRVHPKVVVKGEIGHLSGDLEHHPYPTIGEYLRKFDTYTTWAAEEMQAAGKRPDILMAWRWLCWRPVSRFIRRYCFKGGFRNGLPGFFMSIFDSLACIVQYIKLWDLDSQSAGREMREGE